MMCEMFGKAEGCCKGKGGAMHTGDISVGAMTANAIVGGDLPIAAGAALAFKMQKKPNVVVCFLGDGATNEGSYHETMNAAGCGNCLSSLHVKTTCIPPRRRSASPACKRTWRRIAPRSMGFPGKWWTATTSWRSTKRRRAPLRARAPAKAPRYWS